MSDNFKDYYIGSAGEFSELKTISDSIVKNSLGTVGFSDIMRLSCISAWVRSHIFPGDTDSGLDSSLDIIKRGSTQCRGYSRLFVSLAHTQGFDGRVVILGTYDAGHFITEIHVNQIGKCSSPNDKSPSWYGKWVAFDVMNQSVFMKDNLYMSALDLFRNPDVYDQQVNHGFWNYQVPFFKSFITDLQIVNQRRTETHKLSEMGIDKFEAMFYGK